MEPPCQGSDIKGLLKDNLECNYEEAQMKLNLIQNAIPVRKHFCSRALQVMEDCRLEETSEIQPVQLPSQGQDNCKVGLNFQVKYLCSRVLLCHAPSISKNNSINTSLSCIGSALMSKDQGDFFFLNTNLLKLFANDIRNTRHQPISGHYSNNIQAVFCFRSFWLLRFFRFCLSMITQWGLHEALSDHLSSPSIHFFFLLVKKGMNSSILTATKPAIPHNSIAHLHATEVALFRKFRVEI